MKLDVHCGAVCFVYTVGVKKVCLLKQISTPSLLLYKHVEPCSYHVEVDYHFIRKKVARKFLEIRFISTEDQIVDGFTRPLTLPKLQHYNLNLLKPL
jgi:hypothetical protein